MIDKNLIEILKNENPILGNIIIKKCKDENWNEKDTTKYIIHYILKTRTKRIAVEYGTWKNGVCTIEGKDLIDYTNGKDFLNI